MDGLMSEEIRKFVFKIVVLGTEAVGKTSLIEKFSQKTFNKEYKPTLGTNIIIKELTHENFHFKFMLWDIAGQQKWAGMRHLYYKGAQGALLVFDVTRPPSLNDIPTWNTDLQNHAGIIPKILVANKIDLEMNVKVDAINNMASSIEADDLIQTSAKTGKAVDDAFIKIALEILKKIKID
ncbi:MAG: GTP-binding protein [Candidatus Lokiarchaeota archaeon]|nr:GTP-binding protein [Candidatus Lokiarchaeota archaeon]